LIWLIWSGDHPRLYLRNILALSRPGPDWVHRLSLDSIQKQWLKQKG
jgi:hypothetical protein